MAIPEYVIDGADYVNRDVFHAGQVKSSALARLYEILVVSPGSVDWLVVDSLARVVDACNGVRP